MRKEWKVKIIVLFLALLSFIGSLNGGFYLFKNSHLIFLTILFAFLIFLGDIIEIRVSPHVIMSLCSVFIFASILTIPLPLIPLTCTIAITASEFFVHKRVWYKALNNISEFVLSGTLASLVANFFITPGDFELNLATALALVLGAITYSAVTTFLIALVVSQAEERSFPDVWLHWVPGEQNILPFITLVLLGILFAYLFNKNFIAGILCLIPLALVYLAFKKNQDLEATVKEVLMALAKALDSRDFYTFEHSQRVATYAKMIGEKMKLNIKDLEAIESAALLHDLGKVNTPDEVLLFPGHLDEEGWKVIKLHPRVGADILKCLTILKDSTDLIHSHHEHVNGSGYPRGLKGNDIPLGARILAVADAYDAMRSERPYRKAYTREEAIAEITKYKGKYFDSEVVNTFLEILDEFPLLGERETYQNKFSEEKLSTRNDPSSNERK